MEPQLRIGYPAVFPELRELVEALERAVHDRPARDEVSARCRLALAQVLHIGESRGAFDRVEALLEDLRAPYRDWPLARYAAVMHSGYGTVDVRSVAFRSAVLEQLRSVEPGRLAQIDLIVSETARELASQGPERTALLQVAVERAQEASNAEGLSNRQAAEAQLLLARAREMQQRYLEARLAYDEAVDRDSNWNSAKFRRANFFASLGDREQALTGFEDLSPNSHKELRSWLAPGGKWEQALLSLDRRAQLLGHADRIVGEDPTRALLLYDKGRALSPTSGEFFARRATTFIALGDYEAALAECKQGPPDHPELLIMQRESERRLGLRDD
jgi:tetratricopeptide (TPR) repeat protein